MDNLYIDTIITKSISIEPSKINRELDNYILNKLKETYEGKCVKHGYVKINSITILKRSMGSVLKSHFNGSLLYNIKFSLKVCNPLEGTIINAVVTNINKMGILASIVSNDDESPLNILLARQHHMEIPEFFTKNKGDVINIKVIGKRFEFGDNQISVIGILHDK